MMLLTEKSAESPATQAWYGVRTKIKFEKVAAASLEYKGYVCYLPCYRHRRRWSDRVAELQVPLFSGYVFCRFDVTKRLPILTTPGIVSMVGVGKQPLAIPDSEIDAIETIIKSGTHAEPWPYLNEGQHVRIESGSLRGLGGVIVKKKKNEWRLVVSVNLLQRSVAVELDRECLRAIR